MVGALDSSSSVDRARNWVGSRGLATGRVPPFESFKPTGMESCDAISVITELGRCEHGGRSALVHKTSDKLTARAGQGDDKKQFFKLGNCHG